MNIEQEHIYNLHKYTAVNRLSDWTSSPDQEKQHTQPTADGAQTDCNILD